MARETGRQINFFPCFSCTIQYNGNKINQGRRLQEHLCSLGVFHVCAEGPGTHASDFFDRHLLREDRTGSSLSGRSKCEIPSECTVRRSENTLISGGGKLHSAGLTHNIYSINEFFPIMSLERSTFFMLQTLRSDRLFRLFFLLIVIFSMLYPLAANLLMLFVLPPGTTTSLLSRLITGLSAAATVLIVLAAFRYPLKDCLLLVLPGFVLNLVFLIVSIFADMVIVWYTFIFALLQIAAGPLLLLLVAKLALETLKKEALAALLVFLFWPVISFFVFGLPVRALNHVPISFTGLINLSRVLLHLAQFLLYLLIRFFFVPDKKTFLRNAFYTVRNLGT